MNALVQPGVFVSSTAVRLSVIRLLQSYYYWAAPKPGVFIALVLWPAFTARVLSMRRVSHRLHSSAFFLFLFLPLY